MNAIGMLSKVRGRIASMFSVRRMLKGRGVKMRSTRITIKGTARLEFGLGIKLVNCQIQLADGCVLRIADGTRLTDFSIKCSTGSVIDIGAGCMLQGYMVKCGTSAQLSIGAQSKLDGVSGLPAIVIRKGGSILVDHHAKIIGTVILAEESAQIKLGAFFGIGQGSTVRAASSISIGDYCLASYGVQIYDTNSHSTDHLQRRQYIEGSRSGLAFKEEVSTAPIVIGHDVWLGRDSAVLKGVLIADQCIVGMKTMVASSCDKKGVRIVSARSSQMEGSEKEENPVCE